MKTMAPLWTLSAVALLVAQTVVGFGLFDVLRASRQLENSQRDVMSPADVLVHVVLEELDGDKDGQITLAEIEGYFELLNRDHPRLEEEKGYIITIATLLDVDQSGIVELDELQRAATVLVANTGTKQVGQFIGAQIFLHSDRQYPAVQAGEMAGDFLAALDADNDGLVSTEERDTLLTSKRLRWSKQELSEVMNDADQNNDGNLDQSETSELLMTMAGGHRYLFRKCRVYARIFKLAGAETAGKWLNPHY